jgi:predicted O-linked N-acetylglucosamine transferase (SPINDLY family)
MTDVFALHDRTKFEITGIAYNPNDGSAARSGVAARFDKFIDASKKDDREVAKLIRELEIDIAVDLDGFTQGSRMNVMAQRPAPLQVAYLGYPATLGADYMDYLIADRIVIPPESEKHFTEKIVALPGSYQANSQRPKSTQSVARNKHGLPDDGFVFCCFNNNYKITPDVFSIWMRLLLAVSGGVLWLRDTNQTARANLRREAEKYGVAPERLVFAPPMDWEDHLARHQLADLFLDTFHYNAHTTGSDALWAGLPVLSCQGKTFASRVGASLLSALGLEELITHSPEAYESTALALATDRARLAAVTKRLRMSRQTSPLFDAKHIAGNLDKAFDAMWRRHRRGDPPAGFAVTPET